MGVRIINQDNSITVIEPFAKAELHAPVVQCWFNVQTHEHNLIYVISRRKKTAYQTGFVVEFSVPAFRIITKTGNPALEAFAKKLKGSKPVLFSDHSLPMDAAMLQCIYSITHYNHDELLKPMYVYARIVDLLRLQQQCFIRIGTRQLRYVKTEYDKERIVFARDYLLTHMDAPPTLAELAIIAGINEFKLKRGFKELFNHTLFGFLADVRLEMAKTALRQKQKTVSQIAFELGYASLQHFSAAFKKKFGMSPAKFS